MITEYASLFVILFFSDFSMVYYQVGYGRGTPTNVLWLGNLPQNPTEGQIQRQFHPFGYVKRVIFDRQCCQGLLSFDTVDAATAAFENMRGRFVLGRKILVRLRV